MILSLTSLPLWTRAVTGLLALLFGLLFAYGVTHGHCLSDVMMCHATIPELEYIVPQRLLSLDDQNRLLCWLCLNPLGHTGVVNCRHLELLRIGLATSP